MIDIFNSTEATTACNHLPLLSHSVWKHLRLVVSAWDALSPTGGEQARTRGIVSYACCWKASCKHLGKKLMLLTAKKRKTERNPVFGDTVNSIESSLSLKWKPLTKVISAKIFFLFVCFV